MSCIIYAVLFFTLGILLLRTGVYFSLLVLIFCRKMKMMMKLSMIPRPYLGNGKTTLLLLHY